MEWAYKQAKKYNAKHSKNWNDQEIMRSAWAVNGGAGAAERFESMQARKRAMLKNSRRIIPSTVFFQINIGKQKLSPPISSCKKYDYGSNEDVAPIVPIKDTPDFPLPIT